MLHDAPLPKDVDAISAVPLHASLVPTDQRVKQTSYHLNKLNFFFLDYTDCFFATAARNAQGCCCYQCR